MRILHAILAFYPCQIWGGPPQNALALCKELLKRGHEVTILTTNILDHTERISTSTVKGEWEGIPVTYLNAHWRGHRSDSVGFIWSNDVLALHREYSKADIIHIHGYREFMFFTASIWGNLYGIPYIVQPRGSLPAQLGRSRLKRIVDVTVGNYLLRNAGAGLALSSEEAERLRQVGLAKQHIHKVFNPFDPELCPSVPPPKIFRERYNVPSNTKIVLFLARLHMKKGLDLLIRAIDGIRCNADFKLFIVGPDDGYGVRAHELVNQLGLVDRVVFVGPLYGKEKFEAYSSADLFVLPTIGVEGLPTTIIEACYTGTPVIVTRQTEIAALVDGKVGLSIDCEISQLRNALKRLLDDDNLRLYYAHKTREFVRENFNLKSIVDQIEQIYVSVLSPENDK